MLASPPSTGLLLLPDSAAERVMAFDADYIPSDPIRLRTPATPIPLLSPWEPLLLAGGLGWVASRLSVWIEKAAMAPVISRVKARSAQGYGRRPPARDW